MDGPLACEPLARVVTARTADVLAVLRDDGRFAHVGAGSASRWRLVLPPANANGNGKDAGRAGRIHNGAAIPTDGRTVAARLEAIERRLGALEAHLADAEPSAA
jgi:hypothetical protein